MEQFLDTQIGNENENPGTIFSPSIFILRSIIFLLRAASNVAVVFCSM